MLFTVQSYLEFLLLFDGGPTWVIYACTFQLLPDRSTAKVLFMQEDKKERWQELCALAANEQNPEKLLELVTEINKLLEEKEERLRQPPPNASRPPKIE
jgi:hypothetical protein